ncbi:replication protein [Gracilibacillus salinarum]|uniref:Replication protein n=1 Tax=Gracilibacillus salinarum TaxID=2932255 RepID=A0ABY4GN53_9BACI|nr:replication protein [Gracilibacillus salinarum]UOQ85674.1 replication protein [Gracilibacillus salinarum]
MANPQKEEGYTGVANEILNEIMKVNLNGTQFRLIMAVWRYTYGFQTKDKELSIRFLASKINANRSQVDRELRVLLSKNIIKVSDAGKKGARKLRFNKNYEQWNKQEQESNPVPEPKKNPSNVKPKYDDESTYYKMATYFYKRVQKVAEDAGIAHLTKKANMQTWADDMRKLIEIDQVEKRKAKEVMDWVTTDPFWRTNILSAKKLRLKFMELAIKMNAESNPITKQKPQPKDGRDKEIAFQKFIQEGGNPDEFNWND